MKSIQKELITLFLCVIGLLFLYKLSQNGRYQIYGDNENILDTRNGKIYRYTRNGNNNPENGPIFKWETEMEEVK